MKEVYIVSQYFKIDADSIFDENIKNSKQKQLREEYVLYNKFYSKEAMTHERV